MVWRGSGCESRFHHPKYTILHILHQLDTFFEHVVLLKKSAKRQHPTTKRGLLGVNTVSEVSISALEIVGSFPTDLIV